ncbi:MAG: SDR family oxidoreductase [Myxococcales bacterium]|nr:SDR family oxidoreductase [Myxococcales bacterium]
MSGTPRRAAGEGPEANARLFCLQGRVAVVTGAAGLLGREHAFALGNAGGSVVCADLPGERLDLLLAELTESGIDATAVECDVTSESQVRRLARQTMSRYDRIDVLVNNAGLDDKVPAGLTDSLRAQAFENYSVDWFRKVLDVNVVGAFICTRELGQVMAGRAGGSIINIGSTYALVAPDQSLYESSQGEQLFYKSAAYPVSKGALLQLTRFTATYWGKRGVRANTLCPGGVFQHQPAAFVEAYAARTPAGRMADASDYRAALVFLASDGSAYMNGQQLVVDGGWTAW